MRNQPEPRPVSSERTTVELCGHELRAHVRCILPKGHGGPHELHALSGGAFLTWR